MENTQTRTKKQLCACLLLLLIATLLINLLSSYIRHTEAGLGCAQWPGCYGQMGSLTPPAATDPMAALTPAETAKRAHRTIATILVFGVLLCVYLARQLKLSGMTQYLPYLMVSVILLLSVVGPASYLKTYPAIASVNLLGGMTLLTLIWWLRLALLPPPAAVTTTTPFTPVAVAAMAALIVQLALGAWVSANFAGLACTGLWNCEAQAGTRGAWSGMWYLRELGVDQSGRIVTEQAQVFIHQAHKVAAAILAAILAWLGLRAISSGGLLARWGTCLLGLLIAQLALGLISTTLQLPLLTVLAHSLVASLLLLCLLRMLLLTQPQPVGRST